MIANKLYGSLSESEKEYLHIFNYVAKDQMQPIHNKFKKRSCHSTHYLRSSLRSTMANVTV